jgi:hypothetical protein
MRFLGVGDTLTRAPRSAVGVLCFLLAATGGTAQHNGAHLLPKVCIRISFNPVDRYYTPVLVNYQTPVSRRLRQPVLARTTETSSTEHHQTASLRKIAFLIRQLYKFQNHFIVVSSDLRDARSCTTGTLFQFKFARRTRVVRPLAVGDTLFVTGDAGVLSAGLKGAAGIEPATCRLEAGLSNPLSYAPVRSKRDPLRNIGQMPRAPYGPRSERLLWLSSALSFPRLIDEPIRQVPFRRCTTGGPGLIPAGHLLSALRGDPAAPLALVHPHRIGMRARPRGRQRIHCTMAKARTA